MLRASASMSFVAAHMLALELVERRVELARALAQLAEQVRLFLRMMQLLREYVDVMQHRAQQRKLRRSSLIARLPRDELEAVDDRGERAVLVADRR